MRWSWKRPSIPEKYQPWLKENQWWIQLAALCITVLVIAIAFRQGKWLDWVGFRGKTVWDWLSLLGVPLTLAILGYILQQQERNRAETLSREQRERDEAISKEQQRIATDEAKEEILQIYFDRLSSLLVDKNILAIAVKLYSSPKMKEVDQPKTTITHEERELLAASIDVIRARTLSILRRFGGDQKRINSIIRFLRESEVFSKAKLRLDEADLTKADLTNTDLREISLSNAKFEGANLEGANLGGANLVRTDFRRANLVRTYLGGANLEGANLVRANLEGANLEEANLEGANLVRANLEGAALGRANLVGAQLGGANLKKAHFFEARFSGAYLSGVCLEGAYLYGAYLGGVHLKGANLRGADLQGADLQGADLQGADLQGTYLVRAHLVRTNLEGANLKNIEWDCETQWPDSTEVAKAKNIPEALKQQLGITDTTETETSNL